MGRFNKKYLMQFQKIWEQNPEGLAITEFVRLMLDLDKAAPDSDKVETLHAAMKLFNEIDINCDGTMEWSEFLQYLIDQVQTESLQPYFDKVTNTYVSI